MTTARRPRPARTTPGTKRPAAQAARCSAAVLHSHLSLIEVADPLLLEELRADRRFGPLLVAQLSDCVAVVKPGASEGLLRALLRAGHTPRVVTS
ncbi:MAG: hypothetical protein AB7N91_24655 [Candidatus Tectimicrobiota bacterium]